jgi:methylene-fatty-acyl-phospholipid synthase
MAKAQVEKSTKEMAQKPISKDPATKQLKRQQQRDQMIVRSIFAAAIIVPQVILLSIHTESENGPSPFNMYRQMIMSLARFPAFLSDTSFLLVCFLLSLQNLSYTFVWIRPKLFSQICKRPPFNKLGTPVDAMVAVFFANKVIQFVAPFLWYASVAPLPSLSDLTWYQFGTAIQFIVIGQILNVAIYQAIGKVGVYYGTRLGRHVPWVDGFPFNLINHPQYCGVVLSAFGICVLAYSTPHIQAGLFGLFVVQVALYVIMGLVEHYW